jgi:hypothetical protein
MCFHFFVFHINILENIRTDLQCELLTFWSQSLFEITGPVSEWNLDNG